MLFNINGTYALTQTRGTPSFGKRHTKTHTQCRRCGRMSFHIQKHTCASCGFPAAKTRAYGWSLKTKQRRGQGTGRMRYMKTIPRINKNVLKNKAWSYLNVIALHSYLYGLKVEDVVVKFCNNNNWTSACFRNVLATAAKVIRLFYFVVKTFSEGYSIRHFFNISAWLLKFRWVVVWAIRPVGETVISKTNSLSS